MHIMRAFGDGFLLPGFRHQGSPVALSQVSEITANRDWTRTDRGLHRCARQAGYLQLELEVVAVNHRAVELYKSVGFIEYGRNPKGFLSRNSGWQENVLMRLEL